MKTPVELIKQIIRAKMALQLRLTAASREGTVEEIGGCRIEDMIAEVDAGRARYEQMLVCFKNEIAAAEMMAAAGMEAEESWSVLSEPKAIRKEL